MESDGLIERTVYPEVPPRVEYQLTPFGETLRPVIDAMWAWGKQTRESRQQEEFSRKPEQKLLRFKGIQFILFPATVELRSTGQPGAAVPTCSSKVKIPTLTAKNAVRMGHPIHRSFITSSLLRLILTQGPGPAWRWLLSKSRRCWRRLPGCRACRIFRPFRSSSGGWRS